MNIVDWREHRTWKISVDSLDLVDPDFRWSEEGESILVNHGDARWEIPIETNGTVRRTGPREKVFEVEGLGQVRRMPNGDMYYTRERPADGDEAPESSRGVTIRVVVNWFEELERIAPTGR